MNDFVNNQKDESNSLSYRIFGEYDLIFLGVTHCQQNGETCPWFMKVSQNDHYDIVDPHDVDYMWGTHAYLVTPRCANMIVSEILPLKKHYDRDVLGVGRSLYIRFIDSVNTSQ